MVEIEQLKGHHKEGFGKFINEPSKEQLNLYFYLNDSDIILNTKLFEGGNNETIKTIKKNNK